MRESRRTFLAAAVGLTAVATLGAMPPVMTAAQEAAPPWPGPPRRPAPEPKRDLKAELKANQEAIKKDVAKLSGLVADLKKGLDNSDTKEVLSLDVVRKTEEIEKLARHIRDLVRG